MKNVNNKVIRYIVTCSILIMGLYFVSTTASAYTEEQINQAKAWLSAHGYSPTRAGADQAMSDYENGKLKLGEKEQEIAEKSGVKVKGDDKASDKKTKKKSKKKTGKKADKNTKTSTNNETVNKTKQPSKDIHNAIEASDEPVKNNVIVTTDEPVQESITAAPGDIKEPVEAEKQEFPIAIMLTLGAVAAVCIILLCMKKRNK